ncbi:MAG: CinA family protein [Alphaproteobacteria bacterium]|nr:CinA family protein [Alphaproteobacteria bacterium]
MWNKINKESEFLFNQCTQKNINVTAAESCTGGMIASSIVSINGSSNIFKSSIVTYSNSMKSKLLNIPLSIIETNGSVSEQTAYHMALNVLSLMKADISIAVTGIAGPTGGSINKPVGLVWIAIGTKLKVFQKKYLLNGNRLEIRQKTTLESLKFANKIINDYI